jgi:hypothetical protein
VGNANLAAAYGILWCGARAFDGRKAPILLALIGVVFWLIACSIGPAYARPEARAIVVADVAGRAIRERLRIVAEAKCAMRRCLCW